MSVALEEHQVVSRLINKDLIYSELLQELKVAQDLVLEVKTISAGLQETLRQLKTENESRYLKYEDLPDHVDTKILKEYLNVGTNRMYELINSRGFPKPVQYANGKKVFAKADVKQWLDRQKAKVQNIFKSANLS